MALPSYLANLFAGAFLCNALPHLIAGVQGRRFPTPFAKPPGAGDSPPLVNVLWGSFNLLAGLVLLAVAPFAIGWNAPFVVAAIGFVLMGTFLARHFGRVQAAKGHDV